MQCENKATLGEETESYMVAYGERNQKTRRLVVIVGTYPIRIWRGKRQVEGRQVEGNTRPRQTKRQLDSKWVS
jgi:hypothetical protein